MAKLFEYQGKALLKRIGLFTICLLVLLLVGAAWAQDATPEATEAPKIPSLAEG